MPTFTITDPADPRCDGFRQLKDASQRRMGNFIAESELVVTRLLDRGVQLDAVLLSSVRYRRLAERLDPLTSTAVFVAEPRILDAVVGFPLHRGVLALARRPPDRDAVQLVRGCGRLLVLDDVVDPDNVGAVFRHCAAFGVDGVLLSSSAGDPLYRKAVRTSMGWSLTVPFARAADLAAVLRTAQADGMQTLAFTPDGANDLPTFAGRTAVPNQRLAVIFGSEHLGLSARAIAAASHTVRIEIDRRVDSINVATAAALALYELFGRTRHE